MSAALLLLAAAWSAAAPACPSDASLDAVEARAAARTLLKNDVERPVFLALIDRRLERALKDDDPRACAPLRAIRLSREVGGTAEDLCVDVYHGLHMGRALIGNDPDFKRRCASYLSLNPALAPGAPKACAAMIRHRADPRAGCAEIAPLIKLTEAHCAKTAGHYAGDASLCAKLVGPGHGEEEPRKCLALAAYHKARRSGRGAACGDNLWCRWLLGDFSRPRCPR